MQKTGSNLSINLSAIVYNEGGEWIAHCLELDIVAEGKDAKDAIESLVSLCDFQIKVALQEGDLQSIFRPAPPEVWQMFSSGTDKCVSERTQKKQPCFEAPVDRFEARRLAFA
jgi:hypothetical protein